MDLVVNAFKDAAEQLLDANTALREMLLSESLPVFLPEEFPLHGKSPREAAVASLTALAHIDGANLSAVVDAPCPVSGALCVSPAAAEAGRRLNEARKGFKDAVTALKEAANGKPKDSRKVALAKLLSTAGLDDARRHPAVAQALSRMELSRWNLLWCYRTLHILPPEVSAISWSWLRKPSDITPMTRAEAQLFARKQLAHDESKLDTALNILNDAPGEYFAQVSRPRRPQRKANYILGRGKDCKRKLMATPTVVLVEAPALPRLAWPGPPDAGRRARLVRSDNAHTEPLIPELGLYLHNAKNAPEARHER